MRRKIWIMFLVLALVIGSLGTTAAAAKPDGGTTGKYAITVSKVVVDSQGQSLTSDSTAFTVNLKLGTTIKATGTVRQGTPLKFSGLVAGTYSVEEAPVTGYEQVSISPSVPFTVGGKTLNYAVTITNKKTATPPPPATTLHYVALGDSIATGSWVGGDADSYAEQYYRYLVGLYPTKTVTWKLLAHDGDTSSVLLSKLNTDATFAAEIAKADVITISIGGNNIMDAAIDSLFASIDNTAAEAGTVAFLSDYDQILAKVRQINTGGGKNARILAATLYNPYNNKTTYFSNDPALHQEAEGYIERINNEIRSASDINYSVVEVHNYFKTNYANPGAAGNMKDVVHLYDIWYFMTRYDPHPNPTGHGVILLLHKEVPLS